jgi:hypothetical protein
MHIGVDLAHCVPNSSKNLLHGYLPPDSLREKVCAEVATTLGYLNHRTHLALNKETPIPSVIYKPPDSKLVATPVLNGLYHTYSYQKVA